MKERVKTVHLMKLCCKAQHKAACLTVRHLTGNTSNGTELHHVLRWEEQYIELLNSSDGQGIRGILRVSSCMQKSRMVLPGLFYCAIRGELI